MHNLATSFSSSSSSSPIETPKQLSPSTSQGSSLHLNLSESLQKLHHSWRKEKKKKKKRKACDTYNKGRYSTTKAQIMFEMVIMYSLQNSRNFWKIPALLILPDSDKCGKIPNWNCPNVKTEGKILNWNSPREKSPTLLYVANINISYILCALDISVRPMIELLLLLHQTLLLDFDYCDSPWLRRYQYQPKHSGP